MFDFDQFASRLNRNPDFVSSGKFFDGAIQLNMGSERVWIKVFMGQVIHVTQDPPPFGYTFAIKGSLEGWRFALEGPKNRFREAVFTSRLMVEGNTIEFSRIGKAVHGMIEVLREMAQAGLLNLTEKS
jgi:hypothetical protein